MSQNTQVAQGSLASLSQENSAFVERAQTHATQSSEHRTVARHETYEQRARRAGVVFASCLLSLLASCNVYDSSLLDPEPLTTGGSAAGGSILVGGSGATHAGGGTGSYGGTTSDGGSGAIGDAGTPGTSGGGADPITGGTGNAGSPTATGGATTAAGAGGSVAVGGGGAAGASNPTLSMIDDMENPDAYIPLLDMRQGYWSLSNDGSSGGKQAPSPVMTMTPIPGGRNGSLTGLHTTATGFVTSGALVGVDLNRKGAAATARLTYDASAYKAVHFFAKVETSSPADAKFAILDRHTDPGGALCCPAKTACGSGNISNGLCYDHFSKDLTFTHEWAEYTVAFSDLNQLGWGDNGVDALDAAHVFNIQMSWTSSAMDLWIDDIAFVKK